MNGVMEVARFRPRLRLLCLLGAPLLLFGAFIAQQAVSIHRLRVSDALARAEHLAVIAAGAYADTITGAQKLLLGATEIVATAEGVEACGRSLALMVSTAPWADKAFLINSNGKVTCASDPASVGLDLIGRPEVIQAFEEGSFSVSDAFIAKERRVPLIFAGLPFDRVSGARELLAVTIDLSWFDTLTERIGAQSGAAVALVDSSAHTLSVYPMNPQAIAQRHPLAASLREAEARKTGQLETEDASGRDLFVGIAPVRDTGLRLVVSFDRSKVMARFNQGARLVLLWFAIVAVAMASFVWLLGTKVFVEPIKRLSNLLSATLENMDQGLMVTDSEGRLPLHNRRALELLDLPEDIVKSGARSVLEFQRARGEFDRLSPEDRSLVVPSREGRTVYERETASGTVLQIATVPFGAGIVRTYTDITEVRAQERKLAASEARFRAIAEHSSDIIAQSDIDMNWTYVSPSAARVLGYSGEALLRQGYKRVLNERDLETFERSLASIAKDGAPQRVSVRMRHALGHDVWLEGELSTMYEGARQIGFITVFRNVSERRAAEQALARAHEEMASLARRDALTGLYNRREFDARFIEELRRSKRNGSHLSVLMIDVDHFKAFNDTYGHIHGDTCLKKVSSELSRHIQRPADLLARFGGEEFVILLPETDEQGALRVAENICAGIANLEIPHVAGVGGVVTASIGCVATTGDSASPEEILDAADVALYAAKRRGRNCVVAKAVVAQQVA